MQSAIDVLALTFLLLFGFAFVAAASVPFVAVYLAIFA